MKITKSIQIVFYCFFSLFFIFSFYSIKFLIGMMFSMSILLLVSFIQSKQDASSSGLQAKPLLYLVASIACFLASITGLWNLYAAS
ncbi:hypothetical protein B9G55_04140 [Saccharibacillus sp. O16]|nr:hypothetical protein B9G55_04140 [Saccharibacillus sp. O16]